MPVKKKVTPKKPIKKAVAPVKTKTPVKKAAPAPTSHRADLIHILEKQKFIKKAIKDGFLTLANLDKTPTDRLERMLERGTYTNKRQVA